MQTGPNWRTKLGLFPATCTFLWILSRNGGANLFFYLSTCFETLIILSVYVCLGHVIRLFMCQFLGCFLSNFYSFLNVVL